MPYVGAKEPSLPVSVEQDESRFVIRLEGEVGMSDAAELKRVFLEALASGRKLHLDLEQIAEIDVTFMQLLQAVLAETDRAGTGLAMRLSEAAENALRGAGFARCVEAAGWSG
jgi:hypothetical protein